MMDLIDRQAAIKALEETKQPDPFDRYEYQNIGIDWSIDAIMALPSAQPWEDIRAMCGECDAWNQYKNYPQPGWTPCTPETMPKNEEEVIVSILDDSGDNAFKYTASGWYWVAGDFWVVDNEMNRHVVAWMPLPKPYTGKDGERE